MEISRNVAAPLEFKMPGWKLRPVEVLTREFHSIGAKAFEKGYRQKPHAAGDRFFPNFIPGRVFAYGEDWQAISNPDNLDSYDPTHPAFVGKNWPRYTGCDISSAKRRGTVITTIAVSPQGNRIVIDVQSGKWTQPDFCRNLEGVYLTHNPRLIFVENNTLQGELIKWFEELKYKCYTKIQPFHTNRWNKLDQEVGLPGLDIQFAGDRWRIPIAHSKGLIIEKNESDPSVCGCSICLLVHACNTFTYDDIGNTPDEIMSLWFAKEASRQGADFNMENFGIVRMTQAEIASTPKRISIELERQRYRLGTDVQVYHNGSFGSNRKKKTDFGRL